MAAHDGHILTRPFVVQQSRGTSRASHLYDRLHGSGREASCRGLVAVDGQRDLRGRSFDGPVRIDHAGGLLED
jgi:hypothetical protein